MKGIGRKNAVILVALLVLVIIAYKRSIAPLLALLNSKRNLYSSNKKLLEDRKKLIQETVIPKLEEKNRELKKSLDELNTRFLTKQEIGNFLALLSPLVKETGNALETVQLSSEQQDTDASSISSKSVKLYLKGNFLNLLELFKRIQSFKNLVKIDSFTIGKESNVSGLKTSLSLTFYYLDYEKTEKQ